MKRLRDRPELTAALIAGLMKGIGATLRYELHDSSTMLQERPEKPIIWTFWHNRIFVMPLVYMRYFRSRPSSVMTSASGDGEMIAQVVNRFGAGAVRGSSSRGARAALIGSLRTLRSGKDLVITPDGPRGPRYQMQPGMVKIASLTGTPIWPLTAEYSAALRLRTWDQFAIPAPFSKVRIHMRPLQHIEPDLDDAALAAECERLSLLLHPNPDAPESSSP